MHPIFASLKESTKLANRPLTNNESFALWKSQVTLGIKEKGLYSLLEDTTEDADRAARRDQQYRREWNFTKALRSKINSVWKTASTT